MSRQTIFPLRKSPCSECPFKSGMERDDQVESRFFLDEATPMLCHVDGEFNCLPMSRCRGFHTGVLKMGLLTRDQFNEWKALKLPPVTLPQYP